MFSEYELYCHDSLILDQEDIIKLNIRKTDTIGIIGLIQSCSNLLQIKNGEVVSVDKYNYLNKINNSKREICYINRGDSLILTPIVILYGIKDDDRILVLYNERNVRDAKLSSLKLENKINSIISDMGDSHSIVEEYNKQKKLRKIYDVLKSNN